MDSELEQWIAERPPHVAAVVREYPPDRCYRIRGDKTGHYEIASYSEHANGAVSLRLLHLPDSRLPGVEVFAVPPENVTPCLSCAAALN